VYKNCEGTPPFKFGKTTFNFEREYLQKGLRYQQAVGLNSVINCRLFRVEQKKTDELWSTNHEVVFAHFDLPNNDSAHVFGQLSNLSMNISGTN